MIVERKEVEIAFSVSKYERILLYAIQLRHINLWHVCKEKPDSIHPP